MLEQWEITLTVLACLTVLFVGLFKGFKRAFVLALVFLIAAGLVFLGGAVAYLIQNDLQGLIAYAVAWVPTVIFVLILLVSTATGMRRGLRKSLILFTHAVCAAGVCLAFYFVCVTSNTVDVWMLDLTNTLMGGGTVLQGTLGVSAECASMREVLAEFVFKQLDGTREIGILIRDNGAYVMTLIDLAYRIAFAVLFYFVYLLLVFLLYLVYLVFYPERRYKKKKMLAFAQNKTEISYKKRTGGGGIVGLFRGVITGLISLSFIGSVFFVVAGGTGESKLPDFEFGNRNADFAYSVYRSVENYGAQGIFKVLNQMKDPDDTPYYLYAADLVLSGGLNDEKHDVKGTIKFREELGAYTGFAHETVKLLLKYGEAEIAPVLRGENADGAMDAVLDVMSDPEFQLEFENLVEGFDAKTYFINFSLSLVDSVVANIDEMSFAGAVSEDNKELLKVLFQKGYLSDTIPDERALKQQLAAGEGEAVIRPCLNVNHLFTKRDAQTVLKIVLSLLSGEISVKEPLTLARNLLPAIETLSLFGSERSGEISPVLGRLYCYLENKYLTEAGKDGITYAEITAENVEWSQELRALLGVSNGLLTLYENVKDSGGALDMVLSVFDEAGEHYAQNIAIYDGICDTLADSKLLGKALSSGKIVQTLRTQMQAVGEGLYLPEDIVYENRYDGAGALASHGETYQLLCGLRLFGSGENRKLLDRILGGDTEITALLPELAEALVRKDTRGRSLADYLTDSVVLRSVISTVMIERTDGVIAVPVSSLDTDADRNPVQLINRAELKELLDALPKIVGLILPLTEEEVRSEDIAALLNDPTLNGLLDSGNKILEGTVANAIIERLEGNDTVMIPRRLSDFEEWVTYGEAGELRKILSAIRILGLDIASVLEEGIAGGEVLDVLRELEQPEIEEMFRSDVLHYTVSDLLQKESFGFGDFFVIIPSSSRIPLVDDVLDGVIAKNELIAVFTELKDFGLSSEMTPAQIVTRLVKRKELISESKIISASVVNFLVCNDATRDALNIPERYLDAASRAELDRYGVTNPWHAELPALITALDEIFEISAGAEFSLDRDAISAKMNELLRTMNKPSSLVPERTKLELCYDSAIMRNDVTVELDRVLKGVVSENVLASAKKDGCYKIEEIRALSDAAELFGLDFLSLSAGELTDKVKDELMNINEPREDYGGKTTLEIIYPSAIIRRIATDEIDKALTDSLIDRSVRDGLKTDSVYPAREISALVSAMEAVGISSVDGIADHDFTRITAFGSQLDTVYASGIFAGVLTKQLDDALNEDLIDSAVRAKIKKGNLYPKSEVSALLAAFEEMGMTTTDDLKTYDFAVLSGFGDPSSSQSGRTRLDVLYDSDIVGGVITHAVRDGIAESEGALCDHKSAYRAEIGILKKSEMEALVTLSGGGNVKDCDVGEMSLTEIRAFVEADGEGNPQSYLVAASLSGNLLRNANLVVPAEIIDDGMIECGELCRFLDAFLVLRADTALDDWNVEEDMRVPESSARRVVTGSIVMRATLSRKIVELNDGMVMAKDSVAFGKDGRGAAIAVISEEQLLAFFTALDAGGDGGELVIPVFRNLSDVAHYRGNLGAIYTFDAIRYGVSAAMRDAAETFGYAGEYTSEEGVRLTKGNSVKWEAVTRDVLPEEVIEEILALFGD